MRGKGGLRAALACLLVFGCLGVLVMWLERAARPPWPAITHIEAAASDAPAALQPLPPVLSEWKNFDLPLRICQVRCDTLYTVYRHQFELQARPDLDWALYLPFFDANVAVYLNGSKLDERGRIQAPADVYRYHPRIIHIPALRLTPGKNTLILHLIAERRHIGGITPFYLGPAADLTRAYRWRALMTEDAVLGVFALQVGSLLLALGIYVRRRREVVLGWYLPTACAWLALVGMHVSPTWLSGVGMRWTVSYISSFGALAFTPLFIISIVQPPARWVRTALLSYFALGATLTVLSLHVLPLTPYWQISAPNWLVKISTYLLVPAMFWLVARIVMTRSDATAPWIIAFAAMPGVLGVMDAVRGTLAPPNEYALLPLGGVGVTVALWLELGRRLLDHQRRVSQYAAELEETVRAREAALHKSYERIREADRERALAEERQRLMRDMHDGVGGQLASLVHLAGNPDIGRDQVVDGIREGLADLRLVLDSLAQGEDDPLAALGRLRHRIQPTLEAAGIRLIWDVDPRLDLPAWSPEAVLNIYRLLQEATHNAIRHAHCQTLTIRVRAVDAGLEFCVIDDGVGMPVEPGPRKGFGLDSLRARAIRLGGTLRVDSEPGRGTSVRVTLTTAGAA